MNKDKITRPIKGLVTDFAPIDQPSESYRYALNAVLETDLGEQGKLSTERGDVLKASLKPLYKLVGYINISNDRIILFSRNRGISEIGILDNLGYSVIVNDELSVNKLLFSDAVYGIHRLRKGCEDTIYFVDGLSVRYFNLASPEDFKTNALWDADKFKLQRTIGSIPSFESVVIEDGGSLKAGSYAGVIQYLDEDFNPTEWIVSTDSVIIYTDRDNKPFSEIRGTNFYKKDAQDILEIDKAIRFTIKNLDTSFPYYRIAVVEAATMIENDVVVKTSEPIPTSLNSYLFTGAEQTNITFEELQPFDNIIESAEHIESVDNMLLLANTKGKDVDFCSLQRYASLINTDCVTKEIALNDISSPGNPKRGTVHLEYMGYQPGELYAFGIVYVFKDGTKSPVYHIPGKHSSTAGVPFIENTAPMAINNEVSSTYTDSSNSCGGSLWGVDSTGNILNENTPVRHHRFPTRQQLGIPLVKTTTSERDGATVRTLQLSFKTRFKESTLSPPYPIDFTLTYFIGGKAKTTTITVEDFILPRKSYMTLEMGVIIDQTLDGEQVDGRVMNFQLTARGENDEGVVDVIEDDLRDVTLRLINDGGSDTFIDKTYTSQILGVCFSNIQKPNEDVIGYYIVRAKRDSYNKTVLDSGLLMPILEDTHFSAFGLTRPSTAGGSVGGAGSLWSRLKQWLNRNKTSNLLMSKIRKDAFALIHPEFLFNRKEYVNAQINVEGYFQGDRSYLDHQLTEDVMAGTSYDSKRNKKREADSDGFTLHTLTRYTPLDFRGNIASTTLDKRDHFYLDSLFGKTVKNSAGDSKEIYNLSADNRIGIVTTNNEIASTIFSNNRFPYVSMTRSLPGAYANFRTIPYYLDSKEMEIFDDDKVEIFSGDAYISPMNFNSSMYYNTKIRKRKTKKSFLKFLIAGILLVVAVVVNIIPGVGQLASGAIGAAAIAGLTGAAASLAISMASNGFKQAQANKVYNELYDKGLKDCVDDQVTSEVFTNHNPDDDEVQWVMDTLGTLWFESQVNMHWRNGVDIVSTDFLDSPGRYNEAEVSEYFINKLTEFDQDNSEGKLYKGFANPEVYDLNKAYLRRNYTKVFFALGLEYDCCTECAEEFPHRVIYSQQSFQEELTDNYRKFLPNNYRDIDGETGVITNMFKLGNNVFLHTEEALWQVPRNYQERITDQIVSFLGAGDFFSIPPQKIADSSYGISAGLIQKRSANKNPFGYFYVSEKEARIYWFNGQQSVPISQSGLSIEIGNLLNNSGTFVTGYDPVLQRTLFTGLGKIPFTLSFDNSTNTWTSYHSYIPELYLATRNNFYSVNSELIYEHHKGEYLKFRGVKHPYIVELVEGSEPIQNKVWNHMRLETTVHEDTPTGFVDVDWVTFTKAILYNDRQCTGEMTLLPRVMDDFYLDTSIMDSGSMIVNIDKLDNAWYFNDFRDYRVDYSQPIWLEESTVINKTLNTDSISLDKPWFELDPIKGKYLISRFVFDVPENYKLTTHFIINNDQINYG